MSMLCISWLEQSPLLRGIMRYTIIPFVTDELLHLYSICVEKLIVA